MPDVLDLVAETFEHLRRMHRRAHLDDARRAADRHALGAGDVEDRGSGPSLAAGCLDGRVERVLRACPLFSSRLRRLARLRDLWDGRRDQASS